MDSWESQRHNVAVTPWARGTRARTKLRIHTTIFESHCKSASGEVKIEEETRT